MSVTKGQRPARSRDGVDVLPLPDNVNVIRGTTAVRIQKPTGNFNQLVMKAKKGDWMIRSGNRVSSGMPSTFYNTSGTSTTDNSGSIPLFEKETFVTQACADLTVRGYNTTDELVYWYI